MRGLPYVPFFTSDWLASSARVDMTLPERAVYLDLLFQIWARGGSIPADHAKLAKLALATPDEFAEAWPAVSKHLVPHPDEAGMLTNLKMLDVINKQASNHVAQSQNGRLGGLAKARNRKASEAGSETASGSVAESYHPEPEPEPELELEPQTNTNTCASKTDARASGEIFDLTSQSGNDTSKKSRRSVDTLTGDQEAWFSEVWSAYWRRVSKKEARRAFGQVVKTATRFAEVMNAIRLQSPEMLGRDPSKRPHLASWLRAERWNDELPDAAPAQQTEERAALTKALDRLRQEQEQ